MICHVIGMEDNYGDPPPDDVMHGCLQVGVRRRAAEADLDAVFADQGQLEETLGG